MRSRALVACAVLEAYVYDERVINRDPTMENVISPRNRTSNRTTKYNSMTRLSFSQSEIQMRGNSPSGDAMGPLVSGLAARGKPIVVGVPGDPIQLNAFLLVFGGRSIYGSLAGTAIDTEDVLAFSVLENIRPMIETLPFEQAADAYAA